MKRIGLVRDRNRFWEIFNGLLTRYGHEVILIDAFSHQGCENLLAERFDGFIWRAKHTPSIKTLARRLLYFFDVEQAIPTFPTWNAFWHYDDKIAQYFILKTNGIPIPKTHLFYDRDEAMAFADEADYPLIYKCAHGAGSSNVGLLENGRQARAYIKKAFGRGIRTYFKSEVQRGYVLFQAFLKKNTGDYRLVCHGRDRMSGFFRHNKKDAPFASGSGQFDLDHLPDNLLAFTAEVHRKLGYDTMSYDILKDDDGGWVITEMSVIFGDLSHTVYDQAPVYGRDDKGNWSPVDVTDTRHEQFIRHLLTQWGWHE